MTPEREIVRFEFSLTLEPFILTLAFSITSRGFHLTWSAFEAQAVVEGPPSFAPREAA